MLDDPQRRKAIDQNGMLGIVGSLPEQLEEGLRLSSRVEVQPRDDGSLVVFGMGGSAIAGDLAGTVARAGGYPVHVVRDFGLPPFIRPEDLLVFLSYSGDTWETLSCYRQALSQELPTLAVSSGGELRDTALSRGSHHLTIPAGLPPRGALGYLLAPLLALLSIPLPDLRGQLDEAIHFLGRRRERWSPSVPSTKNRAKSIAMEIRERTPIVYAPPHLGAVGRRWQTEFNEMAKVLAWSGVFPEANHNELVGWMEDPDVGRFAPIVLTAPEDSPLNAQMEVTIAMMRERVSVLVVEATDTSLLNQVLELVHLGDMVSVYLAIARGVDPYPVGPIDRLKEVVRPGRR